MKTTTVFAKTLVIGAVLFCQAGFARTSPDPARGSQGAATEKIVRAYYAAFEKKDWNSLLQVVGDGFNFSSPVDEHINIKAFKERCWPNAYKIKRFDLTKLVVNGDEAFVVYNGWTTEGKLFRNCEYFKLKDGKIKDYECFFGPGVNYPNSGK